MTWVWLYPLGALVFLALVLLFKTGHGSDGPNPHRGATRT